ncbi:hypothetical protein [Halosolutus halophilus]|uniref:hypothetical protein n=1 Tax=Halosolutus halophilus TaxID=1552990 RepID=UPI0022352ADF|nr:hypothetical protein [Halosolutus halophilus]
MNLQHPRAIYLLLLVLGIAVLLTGGGIADSETKVQQYTAFEVTHEDGELVLTDVDTGEERRDAQASVTNVDENIVCLPTGTRECSLAFREYNGEVNSTGISSEFRYAYFDGEFYRLTATNDFEFEFERTDASDAFAALALDSDRLTDTERDALEEGKTVSTQPVPHPNHLVEHGGKYYTILQTGSKVYGDSDSFCSSSGDDFCDRADVERWVDWIWGIGLGILGVFGALVGGGGLLREYRSD